MTGPSQARAWAPGRATFVGDHTDYNFGLSLATTLPRGTWTKAQIVGGTDSFLCLDGRGPAGWEAYLDACMRLIRDMNLDLPPVRVEVRGDLPIGKGLSSSASLIASALASLHALLGTDLSATDLANQAQRVENDYLGIPTGTLDQEVIIKSRNDVAVLVDFGHETSTEIPLPPLEGHRFLVVDPGLPRQLDLANFGTRRAECTAALDQLLGSHDREAWLRFRDTDGALLQETALPELLTRRLAHVWSENRRVQEMITALATADTSEIAAIINHSHESLRDNFEVSTPAIEKARESLLQQPGVLAARLIGAGFGGCLLAFVTEGMTPHAVPSFALH